MKITKADVAKFRKLYLKHFAEELSHKQARTKLGSTVHLMDMAGQAVDEEQFIDLILEDAASTMRIIKEIRRVNRDNNRRTTS